jgi:hypothetical protein
LVINEFLQNPFGNLKVSTTDKEPSLSSTRITLNRGELVGDVKLRHEEGSDFIVNTPVGAAGIRGTVFRIVFRPGTDGKAFFQLTTATGRVEYTPPGQGQGNNSTIPGGTQASGTAKVDVPQGQEVLIVDVDVSVNAQGQVVVTALPPAPPAANNATSDAITKATSVAIEIATATANTVFTTQNGNITGSVTGNQPVTQNFTTDNAQGTVTVPQSTQQKSIPAGQLSSEP